MRVGLVLPHFRADPEVSFRTAERAEEVGLDGAFVFDHLWPIGRPVRPALHSTVLLGALAVHTARLHVGPLVARVGLVPDAVLVHTMETLARMAGSRLVVGLGIGDNLSRPENLAYGVGFLPVHRRLDALARCCGLLGQQGIVTWVGGRSEAVQEVAAHHADALNLWGVDASEVARAVRGLSRRAPGRRPPVTLTWGGQVLIGSDREDVRRRLDRHGCRPGLVHGTIEQVGDALGVLARAGASWAVCAPLDAGTAPDAVDLLGEVKRHVPGPAGR